MKRTAIYARFSTELQQERSIGDQVELCRSYAARNELEVVAVYDDRARSGASIYGRDGLMRLLDGAWDGKFEVILLEALDRLSRDQEDLAGIWKRLNFLGIELRAVHEGTADQIQIGVRGLLGSLFLTDLAHKVRRGMQGVIRDGRHAGGRAYGYRPVPGKPGELEIVEEEAQIVRQIFGDYVGGETPREIAFALNKKGVTPPRGGNWTASTINGNKKRHHGILLNELYAGQVIWNRVKMVKDPDTGRRISRSNPPQEWKRADARHLAIVDAALFNAAQQRKAERTFEAPQKQRKARFLLSGLLKCGCCGGGLSMKDRDHGRVRIHCSTMRESGSCENRKIFYMDDVEKSVLAGLQQHLKTPRLLKEFAKSYQEERERLASEKRRVRGKLETQLGQIQRGIDRLWADYEAERVSMDIAGPKLKELHAQKLAIEEELSDAPVGEKIVGLHPASLREYEEQVRQLQVMFGQGVTPDYEVAANKIRSLISRVTLRPSEEGFKIELQGRLALLMDAPTLYPNMRIASSGGSMVAEVRYSYSPHQRSPSFLFDFKAGTNPVNVKFERSDGKPAASFDLAKGDTPSEARQASWIRLEAGMDDHDHESKQNACKGESSKLLPIYGVADLGTEMRPAGSGDEPSSGLLIEGTLDIFGKTFEPSAISEGATRIYPASTKSITLPPARASPNMFQLVNLASLGTVKQARYR